MTAQVDIGPDLASSGFNFLAARSPSFQELRSLLDVQRSNKHDIEEDAVNAGIGLCVWW